MTYTPRFETETDELSWTDCAWAAALMLANKASRGAYPTTRAEREALRYASGDHSTDPNQPGSSSADVSRGLHARYGHTPSQAASRAAALSALVNGAGASLGLTYGLLPARLRSKDPTFTAGHRVYAERYDPASGRLWWMDPLGRGSYAGEWVQLADVDGAIWWNDTLTVPEGSWAVAHPVPPPAGRTYTVKPGDTLWSIAATFYRSGALFPRIALANRIPPPFRLTVGRVLRIP